MHEGNLTYLKSSKSNDVHIDATLVSDTERTRSGWNSLEIGNNILDTLLLPLDEIPHLYGGDGVR